MARVLVSHCGRFGDLLWALPATRAIAETVGEPVDFCISEAYGSIAGLVGKQEYIGKAWGEAEWQIRETAPITPAEPPVDLGAYDKVVHLSMKGWPLSKTLAEGYWLAAREEVPGLREMDLERPWIKADPEATKDRVDVAVGFSDNWFELKVGIFELLTDAFGGERVSFGMLAAPGSRWATEMHWMPRSWEEAATLIWRSRVYLGCCSALWVLANALGKRTVIAEPMEGRWDKVFWLEHQRNVMVMGGDGRPTWDARAVVQQVRRALEEGGEE
jgi:hypothetical protein